MLSPKEFTVGTIADVTPLSLILPISSHDQTLLVGWIKEKEAVVFLSGNNQSLCFESKDNDRWGGIIIPSVRVEIDASSVIDKYSAEVPPLSVIRTGTILAVTARTEKPYRHSTQVTLHDNLPSAGEFHAVFTNWQIVLGEGENKRIMWSKDMSHCETSQRPK